MLKRVRWRGSELFIYPTFKGLVSEGEELEEALGLIGPEAVAVALSDRELAEVRFALRSEAGDAPEANEDYVPESEGMRRALTRGKVEPEDGEGEGDDEEDGDEDADGMSEELDMPAGVVSREDVERARDEPFHPDIVAADAAAFSDQVFISDTDMAYSRKLASFGDVELPPPSYLEAVRWADRGEVPLLAIDLTDDEYTQVFVDHVTYWQLVRHSGKVKGMRRYKARDPSDLAAEWDRRVRSIKGFDVLERERARKMGMELADLLGRYRKVLVVIDVPRVEETLQVLADQA